MKLNFKNRSQVSSACAGLLAASAIAISAFSLQATAGDSLQSGRAGIPSNAEIFGFVQDIVDFGPRRSGTEAAVRTTDYIAKKFENFGLEDISVLTGDTLQWDAKDWGLEVNGTAIPAFYMRYSAHSGDPGEFGTGPDGLNAEFVYVGNLKSLDGIDVKGKIVLADVELREMDMEELEAASELIYDPDKTLNSTTRTDPFTPNNYPFNMASAIKGGAVGFVGILSNYFDSNRFYNEDVAYMVSADLSLSIPGLWVNKTDGDYLKSIISENPESMGNLVLEGNVETVQYRTVVGHLPGKSEETLMVQSHHDSGFMGAVEDASGVAEVLALAKFYGNTPLESRERSMMFVSMDTHFTDYEAHVDFGEKYITEGGIDVVANVTVEHVAREMVIEDGQAVLTGQVDPRIFISSPSLVELTGQHVEKHDYRRSMVMSTELFAAYDDGIPTDVGVIQDIVGMPVISLISAPVYLYDIIDTPDKVAVEQLQPTAELLVDLLDTLDSAPRELLGRDE